MGRAEGQGWVAGAGMRGQGCEEGTRGEGEAYSVTVEYCRSQKANMFHACRSQSVRCDM